MAEGITASLTVNIAIVGVGEAIGTRATAAELIFAVGPQLTDVTV